MNKLKSMQNGDNTQETVSINKSNDLMTIMGYKTSAEFSKIAKEEYGDLLKDIKRKFNNKEEHKQAHTMFLAIISDIQKDIETSKPVIARHNYETIIRTINSYKKMLTNSIQGIFRNRSELFLIEEISDKRTMRKTDSSHGGNNNNPSVLISATGKGGLYLR